jgi:predicted site-specific integrase-resolvase
MELTSRQFADRLGVSPTRVRQWVSQGRIKARLITARLQLIDEREMAKVKDRRPGRPPKATKAKTKVKHGKRIK